MERKKEFYLSIEDKYHKVEIKYFPKTGLVYHLRFLTEVSELREKIIVIPEEDYEKILNMFNPIEQDIRAANAEPHRNIVFPEFTVETGSSEFSNYLVYKLCDNKEVYEKALAIENMILERDPELKSHLEATKRFIDARDAEAKKAREKKLEEEREKELERYSSLSDLMMKYPALFKGRELSLEGVQLLTKLLEGTKQETEETGVTHGK